MDWVIELVDVDRDDRSWIEGIEDEPAGIARRRGDLVDEGPLHVVFAQLVRAPGPAAGAHGLEQRSRLTDCATADRGLRTRTTDDSSTQPGSSRSAST